MVSSTAVKPTKEKLKKMFAHHGVPKRVQSDNGPPFKGAMSRCFSHFSDYFEIEGNLKIIVF